MTKIPNYVLKSFIPACLSFSGYILLSIAKNSLFSCVQQAEQYVYTQRQEIPNQW